MLKQSTHVPNPDDGYEVTDVKVMWILGAGIAMVIFTLISFAVSLVYGKVLNSETHGTLSEYVPSDLADEHNEWVTDVRLQSDPPAELAAHRAAQHRVTNSSGTVSESPAIYHIEIQDALNHVAEHGLPKWEAAK